MLGNFSKNPQWAGFLWPLYVSTLDAEAIECIVLVYAINGYVETCQTHGKMGKVVQWKNSDTLVNFDSLNVDKQTSNFYALLPIETSLFSYESFHVKWADHGNRPLQTWLKFCTRVYWTKMGNFENFWKKNVKFVISEACDPQKIPKNI